MINDKSKQPVVRHAFKSSALMKLDEDKKHEFIEQYRITPNISKVAKAIGVNRRTVYRHIQTDDEFKMAIYDIKQEHLDNLEEFMMTNGLEKCGFMDRIAMLKANRTEFQDKVKHEHKHDHEMIDDLYKKIPKDKIMNADIVE